MKTEVIHTLTGNFEAHAQQSENGIEFWLARDLQHLLGYDEWRNFTTVISKAKTSCEMSGHPAGDHFVDVNKTISMPKGAEKEVPDWYRIKQREKISGMELSTICRQFKLESPEGKRRNRQDEQDSQDKNQENFSSAFHPVNPVEEIHWI